MALPVVTDRASWRSKLQLQAAIGNKFVQGPILHDHDRITPFDEKIHAAPVSMLWESGGEEFCGPDS